MPTADFFTVYDFFVVCHTLSRSGTDNRRTEQTTVTHQVNKETHPIGDEGGTRVYSPHRDLRRKAAIKQLHQITALNKVVTHKLWQPADPMMV